MTKIAAQNMRRCSLCEQDTMRVITYDDGTEVGRCITCDSPKCRRKSCGGHTMDPNARHCKHCGAVLDLRRGR